MKVNVAGVAIDNISKSEVLDRVDKIVHTDKNVYFVTPYSEMLLFALQDQEYKKILNLAEISLPDGIGILWAAKYLNSDSSLLGSLFSILFNKKSIRSVIHEQITGSLLIYDIAALAEKHNYGISLVGGEGDVAQKSADVLKKLYPNLNIKLSVSGRAFDDKIVQKISQSNSDILFVAYSPPKQETWIAQNIQKLNVKLAIGLGGTFDYIAGKRAPVPQFMRSVGLEWLWRLITQPWRLKRIWNAVPVFIWKIYRYRATNQK